MKKFLASLAVVALLVAAACSNPIAEIDEKPVIERFSGVDRAINMTSKDAYEQDDSQSAAKNITVDAIAQEHNFYDDATDWLKFAATADTTYTIETWVYGVADTYLYVYDGSTVKASNDDKASGDYGSKLTFTPTVSKTYTIKCYSYGGRKGTNRGYTISVLASGGGGGGGGVTLPQPKKAWTVLVYLDADNNLSSYGTKDIAEMYGVGSDANINIVALWDNSASTHGYYYIESGVATLLQDVGEVNMGATATATAFVDYAKTNFPADKYAWVWWNHGGAVDRGVCWDDTNSGDHLSEVEQKAIMQYGVSAFGQKFEAVGFDACLMATAEIFYQYKDVAKYIAASEQTEPGDGWDYGFLSHVKANYANGGDYFVQQVLDHYAAWYSSTSDVTFSTADLSYSAALATAIDGFSAAAINSGVAGSTFKSLQTGITSFTDYTKDLYLYMTNIYNSSSMTAAVKTAANAVRSAIDDIIVANWCGSSWTGEAYGCAITMKADTAVYSQLDICVDTQWDEFCTFAGF